MPPSSFQARVLSLIAANRSPESHVAGGIALNFDAGRFSYDIDIFNDTRTATAAAAEADVRVLTGAGLSIEWKIRTPAMLTAVVREGDQETALDWVQDSAVRFFPVQPHAQLGYRLHPFDLATNKVLAAAARREPRDAVDVVEIHEQLFPLGAVVWAAVGKDEGYSPELLLETIHRLARYSDDELRRVLTPAPLVAAVFSRRLKSAVAEARTFIETMPPETVGHAFLEHGQIVQPDPSRLSDYDRVTPKSGGGIWPIAGHVLTAE